MAASVRTIRLSSHRASAWLINQGFQQLAGCWMSSNRWARLTPLLHGRVSITVGVNT